MAKKLFLVPEILPAHGKARDTLCHVLRHSLREAENCDDSAEEREEQLKAFIGFALLAGELGLVIAILALLEDGGEVTQIVTLGFNEEQKLTFDMTQTLTEFWELVKDFRAGDDLIVGHGVLDHMLPCLCKASAVLHVKSTIDLCWRAGDNNPYVFDTMKAWVGVGGESVTLEELSFALNRNRDLYAVSGKQLHRLLVEGRDAELRNIWLRKAIRLYDIYYQMTCGEKGRLNDGQVIGEWRAASKSQAIDEISQQR